MATFNVILRGKNKKGEASVYVTFYLQSQKIEIPARFTIPISAFDKKKGTIKSSYEFSEDRNLILQDIKARANDILVKYRLRNKEVSPGQFRIEYRNPGKFSEFFAFAKNYQILRFKELADGTQRHHKSCLKLLRDFKNPLYFDELTPDFFRKFILYLRRERGNCEVTISKTLKSIAVYLNEAVRDEYLPLNPLKEVKMRGCIDTTAEAITREELTRLVDLYNRNTCEEKLQKSLEFFLFMCFSSLHIGDARELTIDQVSDKEIAYVRIKLRNILPKITRVPLSEPAKHIIKKWIGQREKGKVFKGLRNNCLINKDLKVLADMVGIKIKVSAKTGRHTFATLFLSETKDLNSLRDILGHSSLKHTMVYAHVLDADKISGVSTFNNFKI